MNTTIFFRIWRFIRIPLGIILILFIGLVIYRIPAVIEKQKTEEAVLRIHAQKITLDDVMGVKLPPEPNQELNDSTIEGIDANQNGIRDDVELAIFKLYPDSAKIRAAELQYAMALQNEMTSNVFNSQTLIVVIQEEGKGFFCLGDADTNQQPSILSKEVKNLVFNTNARIQRSEDIYSSYMTSFKDTGGSHCDINLTSLPN